MGKAPHLKPSKPRQQGLATDDELALGRAAVLSRGHLVTDATDPADSDAAAINDDVIAEMADD